MPHKTMFKALESEVADRGIAKINAELNSLNKSLSKIPEKHDRHRTKKISLQIGYAIALALFIIISIALLRNAGITAMIIGGEEHITYVQSVNANITEVQEMTWVLDEHPNLFNLKSVKFSGYLKGEGSAKVYLVGSNGRRFLVLDEKTIRREGIRMITGFAINIPEGTRLAETPDERRITTVIEYNQGTTWDTDDDGTAYIEDGVVDLTVANTEFNWEADGRMLCTKWVVANEEGVETTTCNGNAECCSLAGVAPEEEEWNGPLYIFHGKYGATEQNTVMAQVVFLNQSTGEETYIESTVGEAAYTTVRFVDKPITNFRGACDETCTLPDSLDSAEYTIEVELSTGMELFIGNITYAVDKLAAEPPEEPEEPEELNSTNMTIETNATNPANDNQTSLTATGANVSYSKVKADARYDAIVDATSYDNETDTLTVVFHHNSATPLPVTVKGKADHTLDKNSSSAGENVTLVVSNWSERKFRIVVGSHTEVLEFGEAQEVTLDTTITDAEGETVAATIEVIDSVMEETVAENTGTEMTLEEGDYDVNVELTGLPITKIEIKDVPVYENTTEFIKVSDVAETGELSGYTEVYAIDPTAINFANATVTATATGSRLYKCANWSFDNQTCLDSKWVFLQSIIPGEDYTFVLTPDDPGLAEGSGTFFEGWESNSLSTNNWTQSGAGNDCVIVTQKIYAGSYSLQCMPYGAENSILTTVDTTGYTNVYFSFYATTSGLDSGEYMSADWYNGTAWTNVMPQTQTIDSYTLYNYSLPSSADNNTDLKIRFNCYAGSNNERCFVENVRVTGTYIINNTAPTHSTPVLNSSAGTNTTNENITCYNQSTYDADGDSVKNIINWYKNDTSLAVLNLPFEGTDGNEPSWTKDHSGNANHGTVYGATWSSTGGYNGRGAYSFNGANSYINLGAPSSLNFAGNTSFTISAWVKVMGGTGAHRPIVVKGDTQYTLKIYTNNTFETCAYDTTWKCAYSTSNLTQGAWYHLAARFGNGNVSLWVNGTFQSSTAYSGITTSAYDVNIGRDAQNPARLFNGMIDEVQIFDRALSAEQIQALYQGRTDMMVSQETSAGDIWKCAVTPNDGTTDGSTLESNTLTINAFIDTTPPGTISGLSEASTAKTWINWNWTNPTDSDFAEAIIYLNGTNVANTSSNHYNATGLATYTTYKLTVMTKDTTGNVNTTNVSDNAMTQDGIAPQYSDIKDQNSTQYAPGKSYQFNITWTDNINVNQVTFEFDGINHTNASSSGDEYYISLADLAAGNHTYGWYADDFLNNANQTGNITFSISNAAPALTLTAAPGWSSTYGTEVTVNCTTPDEGVTPQLYRNGTPASIPDVQALGAGEYLYVCNSTSTQNHSSGAISNTHTVSKADTTITLSASPGWNSTYGTPTTVNCSADNNEVTPQLYRNGTPASIPDVQALGAGEYLYVCNSTSTQNHSSGAGSNTATVSKAESAVNLLLNGTDSNITIEVGSFVNETALLVAGDAIIELYEAGALVNSGSSPLTNLTQYSALGTFNASAAYPESGNHTASQETHWITVQDTTSPTVSLIAPAENTTIASQTQGFTFNFTDNHHGTASCTLHIDGAASGTNSSASAGVPTTITNTSLPEGIHSWQVNCTDGSANSGGSSTRTLNIDLTEPNITIIMPLDGETAGYLVSLKVTPADTLAGVASVWYEIRNSSGASVTAGTLAPPGYHGSWNSSSEPDGEYTFTAYANDTAGNLGNSSTNFNLSNTQPYIEILTPDSGTEWVSDFNLQISYQDDKLSTAMYNITNSTGDAIQSNVTDSINSTFYEFTDLVRVPGIGFGNYTLTAYAKDSTGYEVTQEHTFKTSKAASAISLLLNGTASNLTIERTATANLTATRVNGTGPVYLYRNGTLLGSGTTVTDASTYSAESFYNITAAYPETQNHSASSQTLWLTVDDTVPPGPVTNLLKMSSGQNYIYWVWTNPADADFHHVDIYLNGIFKTSTTNEHYYATGLNHSTYYTISIRSEDTSGTPDGWVNDTQRTSLACPENWVAYYDSCRLNDTRVKYYEDTAGCGTTYDLPADNGTVVSCDCVVSTSFYGDTTNFTGNDLSNLQGAVLDSMAYGKIEFTENITINRCLDLDTYADIGQRHAYIDSAQLPEFNRSANITLYSINLTLPRIMADGEVCNSSTCSIMNYSDGVLVFNVTHFTNYSVEESPYCGDGNCNGGETCGSCALDCGACGAGGGGGGGGGGGAPKKAEVCEPNWLCYSWGPCDNNHQSRACFDANACNNLTDKPATERYCVAGCTERWACGEWGRCTDSGVQTRTCNDLAKCGTESRKPLTVQPCEYDFCTDGKQNNGEQGIDCGGSCRDCTREELQEAEMKKNLLTGEAITVAPYEPPNPIYIMPLLFLLVLLIAIIALHKTNLSDRMKKIVTGMHVLLIVAIFLMLLLTFNVPAITGGAVTELVESAGLSGTILTVIVSAMLIGTFTYITMTKGLPDFSGIEKYYTKSKYWTGYAVQKVKWSARRKKARGEIEIELPKYTPPARTEPAAAMPKEDAKTPKAQMLFGDIMKAIDKLDLKAENIGEKVEKIKTPSEAAETRPAAAVTLSKPLAMPEKTAMHKPSPATRNVTMAPMAPPTALTKTQVRLPAKPPEKPPEKEPVKAAPKADERPKPARTGMAAKFGTEDPLKIAEEILKKRQNRQ